MGAPMTLALLLVLAQTSPAVPLNKRGVADESPTAFACTVETLKKGTQCTFEADAPGAANANQSELNRKAALNLAAPLCAQAAKSERQSKADPALLELCKREFTSAAEACAGEANPLFDAKGRFAADARECYQALGESLSRANTLSEMAGRCCACAQTNKCGGGEQCYRALGTPGSSAQGCLLKSCAAECDMFMAPTPAAGEAPEKMPAGKPAKTKAQQI